MAKEKTGAAEKTPDLLKRPRGRPAKAGGAMTGAERIKKLRDERKERGECPCCGQAIRTQPGDSVRWEQPPVVGEG